MSRQIQENPFLSITEKEAAERSTKQGKVLFTACKDRDCALLIQNDRLTAACLLSEADNKIGAIFIGKIKNMVNNIDACFVEIAGGEICFLPLKKAVSPYLLNRSYDGRLAEGDTLLVQIEREAQKNKQASVTAHISLSNDYFVIAMGPQRIGYSSKLNHEQKDLLRKKIAFLFTEKAIARNSGLIQNWNNLLSVSSKKRLAAEGISTELLPLPSTGCVVRTKAADASEAAEFRNKSTLLESFFELTEQYARLLHRARYRSCFTCLKEAPCAVEAVLSELASEEEYHEIVTDNEKLYNMLSEYCNSKPLRLYQDEMLPLSKLYAIESRLETALGSRVWLKSGGYLIIEPTEALTVIDVNSGKYEAKKGSEESALRVNLEAAEEVAHQLRLRNLSGIIVVDFINMTQDNSKNQVMSLLRHFTGKDRVKTTVVDMTPLGLVEITRKKINKPLREQFIQE